MRYGRIILLAAGISLFPETLVLAQSDAQQAYQEAKSAYTAGKYEEAKVASLKASQTDVNNPEVFLLLGQAEYQLGQIDEAIGSWKKTLALAPKEPYATKMVDLLRAQRAGIDDRIKLAEALMAEKLYAPINAEMDKCLADKALAPASRAKILTIKAEAFTRLGNHTEAEKLISEVVVLYPGQYDAARTSLVMGLAKLSVPVTSAEGLTILKKIAEDKSATGPAATAQYEIAMFQLTQQATAERIAALTAWVAAQPQDSRVMDAQKALIMAYTTLSLQSSLPSKDSKLGEYDQKALALANDLLGALVRADQSSPIIQPLIDLFEKRYAANGAHDAAIAGEVTLLKMPLQREQRLHLLRLLATSKTALANDWLKTEARLGKLPSASQLGQLPPVIQDVVAAWQAIKQENPSESIWPMQVSLASQIQSYAKTVPWPEKIEQLRGPEAWAFELVLPVVRTTNEPSAIQSAASLLTKTVDEMPLSAPSRDVKDIATKFSKVIAEAVPVTDPFWITVMQWRCNLLTQAAQKRFEENLKEGNGEANASVSDFQKELLAATAKLVREKVDMSDTVQNLLNSMLQPWRTAGHWAVVELAKRELADALPPEQKKLMEVSIAQDWIEQADRKQNLMRRLGFNIPRELDPLHQKALQKLYGIQIGLPKESNTLKSARQCAEGIIARYKALEYYDVAEAALRIKGEKPSPEADSFAAYQLLLLQTEQAKRTFNNAVKQYHDPDQFALLDDHKKLLGKWEKFLQEHATGELTPQAVANIMQVGQLYEQRGAFKAAAEYYADFAQFAFTLPSLKQRSGEQMSTADQAALAEANALDLLARKLLSKWAADRKPDAAAPEKISPEFATAIAAYKKCMEKSPEGPLAGQALHKIMSVSVAYASYGGWDVSDGIYADLLGSKLSLNQPERLEFARGICHLGEAMPDHARQILSALSLRSESPLGGPQSGVERLAQDKESGSDRKAEIALDVTGAKTDFFSFDGGVNGISAPTTTSPSSRENETAGILNGGTMRAGRAGVSAARAGMMGGMGGGGGGVPLGLNADSTVLGTENTDRTKYQNRSDSQLLAMVRQEEMSRAQQVAQLRDAPMNNKPNAAWMVPQQSAQEPGPSISVLSEAELVRQDKNLNGAYDIFQAIRKKYATTPTAEQARGEILVIAGYWRGISQWQRAAVLMTQYLTDNPTDPQLPQIRLETARDRLSYAAKPLEKRTTRQEMLAEVEKRFDAARSDINKLLGDFPAEKALQQNAVWELAMSYLTQARAIDAVSPTLAQGQYVRSAKELRRIAETHPEHPRFPEISQILWSIGQELDGRNYNEEAIDVWNELVRFDPLNALARQAQLSIAQTYQQKLKRPLRAAEAYQELIFIRADGDVNLQNTIFQIGSNLKNERRWVEALHVLETFVDSFPRHPQAGQALTMVGQIHQTNQSWEDAIAAYRRVINEYPEGQSMLDAKWSIAECTINLSQWKEAAEAYKSFVLSYPKDGKVGEANRRIDILKDLARYQSLIDEKDQRKAFDAQFQIGEIVRKQLNNPVKAIIEYRKVYERWPQSYLAADALFAMGETYLSLDEMKKARENLALLAEKYPTSPLASNAMFLVGKSYEDEADKLGKVTRAEQLEKSKDLAQREAYDNVKGQRASNTIQGQKKVAELKAAGKVAGAEEQEAANAAGQNQFNIANVELFANKAIQLVETMTALELADRQDRVNAALRKAVDAYAATAKIAGGNKADAALLAMATIYDQQLKDSKAAMQTWLDIVRQFSGTNVAEDASWKIAQYYEREGKYSEAVEAYQAFLRNYRRSPNAGAAQFAVAENYEHLGEWVKAMDSYANYINNFADGPLVNKAKEQINWIKTYRL